MLFRDSVSMLVEEVILAMNGEVTIAKLFAKFGRRFAMIIEQDYDQVYTVIFYEIIFDGYEKYIKRSTVEYNQKNCMLIVPGFGNEYDIIDAVDLGSHVENMLFYPLSILNRRAGKKALRMPKIFENYPQRCLNTSKIEKIAPKSLLKKKKKC